MLYEEFVKEIEALKINVKNQKVLLALSGGVDSIVLFHLLRQLFPENLVIAHVNHCLRTESDAEEDFVQQLAEEYCVPAFFYRWTVEQQPQSGIEEAARNMRYQFFKQVMEETGATILMTGHHQDDQVETILMKLTRGSTLEQITGIHAMQPFHKGVLIRPLLNFPKQKLYDYAHEFQFQYVEDETNQELTYTRNRYRNQIIPLLLEENRQLNEHIEQFALDLSDLLAIADAPIEAAYQDLVVVTGEQISFNLQQFAAFPKAMQRAVLKRLFQNLYQNNDKMYKTNYIQMVMDWLAEAEGNSELHLADGMLAIKAYEQIIFQKQLDNEQVANDEVHLVQTTGEYRLSNSESLLLDVVDENHLANAQGGKDTLVFAAEAVTFPLTIRHRRPGDRMTYKGLSGSKKLKDIFIDEKSPLAERDQAWLVEDASGKIIWLIGFRKMYLLSDKETDKLTYILKYKQSFNS